MPRRRLATSSETVAACACASTSTRSHGVPSGTARFASRRSRRACSRVRQGARSDSIGSTRTWWCARSRPPERLHTPRHGIIETRLRASADARIMVALWMIGYEDRPERSGEICVVEIFGRDIAPGRAAVGMGVHPHHDGRIRDDFERCALDIDADGAPRVRGGVASGWARLVCRRASRAHRGPGHRLPDAADAGHLRVPGAGRAPSTGRSPRRPACSTWTGCVPGVRRPDRASAERPASRLSRRCACAADPGSGRR